MPQRIQLSRRKGWRKPEGAIVVARPSRWGNPFLIVEPFDRHDTVRMYRELVVDREAFLITNPGTRWERRNRWTTSRERFGGRRNPFDVPKVDEIREALGGRDLACWCPLDQVCHADVLLELANGDPS